MPYRGWRVNDESPFPWGVPIPAISELTCETKKYNNRRSQQILRVLMSRFCSGVHLWALRKATHTRQSQKLWETSRHVQYNIPGAIVCGAWQGTVVIYNVFIIYWSGILQHAMPHL